VGIYNEIHAKALNDNGEVVMGEQIVTPNAKDYEPDIAWIESLIDCDVFVIVYHKVDGVTNYRKIVLLRLESYQHFVELVEQQSHTGCYASVARLSDTEFFVAYNSHNGIEGRIKVDYCTTDGNSISLESTATGTEHVEPDSRTDIASRRSNEDDETYYVCYDSPSIDIYEIHCARGGRTGNMLTLENTVSQYYEGEQRFPAIAIAPSYPINPIGVDGFYEHYSNSDIFEVRRMIVWQTDEEDGDGWGIAGQFRGISGDDNLHEWWEDDPFNINFPVQLAGTIDESMTISDPVVNMISNVDVLEGATLTFTSGVTIYATPGCSLQVTGGLVVNAGCQFTMLEPPNRWGGIYVSGSATLSGCAIDGAETGITTNKAVALTVDGCAIYGNGVGVYIYNPPETGCPVISNCTITGNDDDGIYLFSTYKTDIHDCQDISGNGKNGILLNDSYATISSNHFTGNADYGVYCYGSSPTLYCNDFNEDQSGEMYLAGGSHPVLWSDNGVDGGSNTFVATDVTLITMVDSYPIVAGGLNYFTIYGQGGFYMADLSSRVPKHDITKNEWSQDPPPASTFFPSDYKYWIWDPTDTYAGCGTGKEGGSNAAQTLFEEGFTAEMAGNTATASTNYMATIAQYPDSNWAQAAAARLFENQRQIGSAYSDLGSYYATVETTYPEDTSLVETAQDLGTRTLVEDAQYPPALNTYEEIMADPPSPVDSAYAAVDHAITVMREQLESPGGLDSPYGVVSTQTISDLLQALHQVIPPVPRANHENYMKPPDNYVLEQNYPNPFNATTTLRYAIPSSGQVRLTIYNIMGQKVATLVNERQDEGYHSVLWNSANLASGVYIYQLQAEGHTLTKKMVLLK
jgi:parallel beta-helix repeat protein